MKLFFVLMAVLFVGTAQAKDFVIAGTGALTCTDFANLYKSDKTKTVEEQLYNWAVGYISGWNSAMRANGNPTITRANMSTEAKKAHLRRYCDQHPLGDYMDAVLSLAEALKQEPR